jgi:FKBP12-rapamycin complex-associated protein
VISLLLLFIRKLNYIILCYYLTILQTYSFQSFVIILVGLIGIAGGGNATKMARFANYLRNLLPSNDTTVMEMASKAMGRLALTGGTFTADYVEFEVKRALEWLGGDRNEGRRHAAVRCL